MPSTTSRSDAPFTKFPTPLCRWQFNTLAADPAQIRVAHPDPEKIRMRRLVSRAARRPVFKQFALKPGRVVQCESQAELDFSLFLDATPQVTAYGEQPFCIYYLDSGQLRKHIPDFAAQIDGQRHVFEIKRDDWQDPDVLERTELLKEALSRYSMHYHLIVPGHLPETNLRNAILLLQRARLANTRLGSQWLQETVRRSGSLTLAQAGWEDPDSHGQSVAREIVEGRLFVDRSKPLTGASLVFPDRVAAQEGV
ncbi:hypothetical protein KHF85_00845 [Xanthomonas translucens pv. graminis]|uniref:hypothetical protein n=1 Tax=Xanthomonas graminis TaxID=3390026 RepID=UPI00253FA613|nr:hypothetical protein [Xanthomonas translucens]WIH05124.1 hypothetical protein KHF85_00845 [Xanthomonas translucens pv. graminis]